VKQTAQMASQKARHVADSAKQSAQISLSGQKAAEDTIEGMNRIREQMNIIAQNMVQLTEKNRSIGDIITSVDQLAKQAKILAINAAIEAAKAGEHGKGFAVVVKEVQQMSAESKRATAQVRTILGEIHEATMLAAKSTEEGTHAVDRVSKQSSRVGDSILELTSSVNESAQAAAQIAISSQEQLVGVDQVSLAMGGIKEAAYQNVQAIQRVESAALNLEMLSTKLKLLLTNYKIPSKTNIS